MSNSTLKIEKIIMIETKICTSEFFKILKMPTANEIVLIDENVYGIVTFGKNKNANLVATFTSINHIMDNVYLLELANKRKKILQLDDTGITLSEEFDKTIKIEGYNIIVEEDSGRKFFISTTSLWFAMQKAIKNLETEFKEANKNGREQLFAFNF